MHQAAWKRGSGYWIAVAVILAIVLVCVAAVIGARRLAELRLREVATVRLEQAVALAEVAEYEGIQRIIASARSASLDPELARAFRSGDAVALERLARELQRSTDGVLAVTMSDPDATVLAIHPADPELIGRSFPDRDWYRGVQEASPYLSEVYRIATLDRQRSVTIAFEVAPIADAAGPVGIMVVVIEATTLGRALDRVADLDGAPTLELIDQNGTTITRAGEQVPGDDLEFDERRSVRGTDWTLRAYVDESTALADLPRLNRIASGFVALVCLLLVVLAAILAMNARRLADARRAAERQEQAFQLNDAVVQRMAVAQMAMQLGQDELALESIGDALDAGRRMIGALADGRADYVRDIAAGTGDDLAVDLVEGRP